MAEENLDINTDSLDLIGDIGAPQTSGNGSTPASNSFEQAMNRAVDDSFKSNFSQPQLSPIEELQAPVGPKVNFAGPDFDQFRYQSDFNPYLFDPTNNQNHERWAQEQGMGDALAKGFDGFASRFGHTFKDYWKGYGRMASALFTWDAEKLEPSQAQMIEFNYKDHKKMMENYVFTPKDEQDDIFSKQTVSEFISNAGFALGTFAGVAIEIAADVALTFASAPAGGAAGWAAFSGTFARLGAKFGLREGVKLGAEAGVHAGIVTGKR